MSSTINTSNNSYVEFQAGVTACLRSWSALRTAVESGWGGGTRESQAKAEQLRETIFGLFNGGKRPSTLDVFDLADDLAIFMEEEFSVTLEDYSEQQVAETILQLYEDCSKGNVTLARQLIANAEGAVAFSSQFPVQLQPNDEDDDDDDDENMVDTTEGSVILPISSPSATPTTATSTHLSADMSAANYISQPLFGIAVPSKPEHPLQPVRQLGEAISEEPPEAEMDEDGFATVKPKGKRRPR